MSFYYANARQPEIIRTVQKDQLFTDEYINQNLSDILRFSARTNYWIKYNNLCKLIGELTYHGFACLNNLQTLGEEYTGIIQIDSEYIALPNKCLQFIAIFLEFAGDTIFHRLLQLTETNLLDNEDLLPQVKENSINFIKFIRISLPYIKAIHRSLFYLNGIKYQISKRLTNINYVLIRYWLNVNHQSIYGYKLLGVITMLQIVLVIVAHLKTTYFKKNSKLHANNGNNNRLTDPANQDQIEETVSDHIKCVLCLEPRKNTSVTTCGHLFCWNCILDWLDQKEECPVCREKLKKSTIIFLKNLP